MPRKKKGGGDGDGSDTGLRVVPMSVARPIATDLSKQEEAYILLNITTQQVEAVPKIEHLLRGLGDGERIRTRVFDYLEGSEEEDARKIVAARRMIGREQALATPLEAYCVVAGITSKRLFGLISQEVMDQEQKATELLFRASHPAVVEATIQMAMHPNGDKDRKMLHQAAGFVPVPRNTVTVNKTVVNNQTNNVAVLPSLEETSRKVSAALDGGQRFLQAAPTVAEPEWVGEDEDED